MCECVCRPWKQLGNTRQIEKWHIPSHVVPLSIDSLASLIVKMLTLMPQCPWWLLSAGPETWPANQPRSTGLWKRWMSWGTDNLCSDTQSLSSTYGKTSGSNELSSNNSQTCWKVQSCDSSRACMRVRILLIAAYRVDSLKVRSGKFVSCGMEGSRVLIGEAGDLISKIATPALATGLIK